MRSLSTSELLGAWERSAVQHPASRGLALLAAACPEVPTETLAQLSIGQRDAALLSLRELTFGPRLVGLADCPSCGEQVESGFNVADLATESDVEIPRESSLSLETYEVRFRLPNSTDLAELEGEKDSASACGRLLARCVIAAKCNGEGIAPARLPPAVVEAVSSRMEELDPHADIQLALACPACGHRWQPVLDIGSFFWAEINAWAWRTLREVHLLASTYGWVEAEVLALSAWRRQAYLEMVGA